MPCKDKEDTKRIQREWYLRNKKEILKRTIEKRKRIKKWFIEYKSTLKCEKCGEDHIATLDFHHKNNDEKTDQVGRIVHNGYNKKRVMEEINKCIVLCSNCHRKRHWIL